MISHRFTRLVSQTAMHIEHKLMKVYPPASELPGRDIVEYVHEVCFSHAHSPVHVHAFWPVWIFAFSFVTLMW